MKYIFITGLATLSSAFAVPNEQHGKPTIKSSTQANIIYNNYLNSLTKKNPSYALPKSNFFNPFVYGAYQGAKDGAIDIAKITGAAILTKAISSGIQYAFPSLFTPQPYVDPKSGEIGSIAPEIKLYITGFTYLVKSFFPSLTQMNSNGFFTPKTMDAEKVFEKQDIAKLKRYEVPIIHSKTANLIDTITTYLKEGKYKELSELSGMRLFWGDSGSGKTESVKTFAAQLYDQLKEYNLQDEIVFYTCNLDQVESTVKNGSAQNIAELGIEFKKILSQRNNGKKPHFLILLSDETQIKERTKLSTENDSKQTVNALLKLQDKLPQIGLTSDAGIAFFLTANDDVKTYDSATTNRFKQVQEFKAITGSQSQQIILDDIKNSIKKRNIQLFDRDLDKDDDESLTYNGGILSLNGNLRAFGNLEEALWMAWGAGDLFSMLTPIIFPSQFSHMESELLKTEYSKTPEKLQEKVALLAKNNNSTSLNFLLEKKNADLQHTPLNFTQLCENHSQRESALANFKQAHIAQSNALDSVAYQTAVRAYKKHLKTKQPGRALFKNDTDYNNALQLWDKENTFTHFISNHYDPRPQYNPIKQKVLDIKHSILGQNNFDLHECRKNLLEHDQKISDLQNDRLKNLIEVYKVDNPYIKFVKIGDNNRFSPTTVEKNNQPEKIAQLNEKFKIAAANRKPFDMNQTARHNYVLATLAKPNRFINDINYKAQDFNQLVKTFPFERKFVDEQLD